MLLQQIDVLPLNKQQGNTDDRNSCQRSHRQTQAKYGLVSKTQHSTYLLLPPNYSVADSAGWSKS